MIVKCFKWVSGVAVALMLCYCSFLACVLSSASTYALIACAIEHNRMSASSNMCESYLLRYRNDKEAVIELSEGGVDLILNLKPEKKYAFAAFYIARGLDVNAPNHYVFPQNDDATPLHLSVVYNDIQRVEFLIAQGADLTIKSQRFFDLTPLELARNLHGNEINGDLTPLINLLALAELNKKTPIPENYPPQD